MYSYSVWKKGVDASIVHIVALSTSLSKEWNGLVGITEAQHRHAVLKTVHILNKDWGREMFMQDKTCQEVIFPDRCKISTCLLDRLWFSDPLAYRLHTMSHIDADKTDNIGLCTAGVWYSFFLIKSWAIRKAQAKCSDRALNHVLMQYWHFFFLRFFLLKFTHRSATQDLNFTLGAQHRSLSHL